MYEPLLNMLKKEFIQIFRDPRMRAMLIVLPLVQVIIFGYAATTDVRDIRTGVYDLDNTPASRDIIARFKDSGYFDVVKWLQGERQVQELIDRGTVKAVFRINRGFSEDLAGRRTARMQVIVDGTDSNTAGIILMYANKIVGDYNQRVLVDRALRASGQTLPSNPVGLASRAWFNPNLESRNFFVPGVIALLVMVITIILSSMAIVREKEIGTIEQIMVTPLGRLEFILGKTIPFVLIGYLDVALISLIATLWFRIPIQGSVMTLVVSSGLYLMSTLGVGLFISTVSATQQQAMMSAFFFMMPATLLSGFIYPIANMPVIVQGVTYLNPLRYYLVVIRGVYLKGVGFAVLWPQLVGMAILGTVLLLIASRRFKKTLA